MALDRAGVTELRRIKYVLFGLQLTVLGIAFPQLFPAVVVGFAVSLVALLHPSP